MDTPGEDSTVRACNASCRPLKPVTFEKFGYLISRLPFFTDYCKRGVKGDLIRIKSQLVRGTMNIRKVLNALCLAGAVVLVLGEISSAAGRPASGCGASQKRPVQEP